ncbi:MAG: DUF547 domain-containing protein [Winogradskyella sp.]|uniref:DUF547 domain-containing protein n=1 Tax=Winogradskyella sp. TaxID=1883156 RepID=UPI00179DBABF|nr:DUF547 domain-containing protein [Winogradskyella sp.]
MKTFIRKIALIIIASIVYTSCISSQGVAFKEKPGNAYQDDVKNIINHSAWDKLLKNHVRDNGLVDYKGFQSDSEALNAYVEFLSNNAPKKSWPFEEQLAYFINLYNANTIKLIVDHYPVEGIKEVDATISPFLKSFIFIGDKKFSLADIEKGILQKMNEPRMHFAINCASISCPKLLKEAYTAENVDELMEKAAREFINSDKNEISESRAKVSEIFKWYKNDFLVDASSIIEYINRYAEKKINSNVDLSYITYNWNLNDTN